MMSFEYLQVYVPFSKTGVLLLFLCLAAGLFTVNLILGRRRIDVALGN